MSERFIERRRKHTYRTTRRVIVPARTLSMCQVSGRSFVKIRGNSALLNSGLRMKTHLYGKKERSVEGRPSETVVCIVMSSNERHFS